MRSSRAALSSTSASERLRSVTSWMMPNSDNGAPDSLSVTVPSPWTQRSTPSDTRTILYSLSNASPRPTTCSVT